MSGGGEFWEFADENWREDTKGALRVVTVVSCPTRGSQFSEFSIMFDQSCNDQKIDFFFKVWLNWVFGIAAPYKQISICLYKH